MVCLNQRLGGLLQVDDVNILALAEDVRRARGCHLLERVP